MIGYVYKITSPTGRVYVGSTKNISKRKYQYSVLCCKNQVKLYASLIKYTFDSHLFEVIWDGDISEMYRNEREFGIRFNVMDRDSGLNLKLPDDNGVPFLISDEVKQKISAKAKIRNIGSGNPFYGKSHSEESKNKIRTSKPDMAGEKNPNYGNQWTEEKRDAQRILVKSKNYKHTDEFKDKQRLNMIGTTRSVGRKASVATRLMMSKNRKRGNNSRAKLTLNISTGIFYDCISDAADSIGLSRGRLKYMLLYAKNNRTDIIYA